MTIDMTSEDVTTGARFGALVQRYRRLAGLSQDALAERTQISTRAIRNLELGLVRTPRRDTIARLQLVLQLPDPEPPANRPLPDLARPAATNLRDVIDEVVRAAEGRVILVLPVMTVVAAPVQDDAGADAVR
jgi:transcriptional regulator with XRE-family HTH domain